MKQVLYGNQKVNQMKPMLEHLPRDTAESFVVCDFNYAYYPTPWHYHPEYEIVLVTESKGTRFIGDSITPFQAGDLALIGPNLPHMYRNDETYYRPGSALRARSIVVHFLEDSLGEQTLGLPEMQHINRLLKRSRLGLEFFGKANHDISNLLHQVVERSGFERWLKLMEVLHIMADCEEHEYHYISSTNIAEYHETDEERLYEVFAYVGAHFKEHVTLEHAASLAKMTPSAFSRYFKYRTRKTFSAFLLELRVGHAAKLLMQTDRSVGEICYESGFNNLSNFNRHFKVCYHMQPREFRKQVQLINK